MTNKGFSLIEVLIAAAVFSVLLSALTAFFISQQRQYQTQTQVAAMQDNARATLDFAVSMFRNSSIFAAPPYGNECSHEIQFISFLSPPVTVRDQGTAEDIFHSLETENLSNDLRDFFIEEFDLSLSPEPAFSCSELTAGEWLIKNDAWWISIDNNYFVLTQSNGELIIHAADKHEFRRYSGADGPDTFGYHYNPDSGTIDPFALNITCFEMFNQENKFVIRLTAETERSLHSTGQRGSITLSSTVNPRNID
jgi:prepilin-type N-terminal cleavage/methylation domain-containing protein